MAANLQNNFEILQERDVSFPPAHTAEHLHDPTLWL